MVHFSAYNEYLFGQALIRVQEISSGKYVFPIYKNGSSTLFYSTNSRTLTLDEIQKLEVVDIYLRDPKQRLKSGIHTFLSNHSDLDRDTALFFIKKFFYLDKHFSPQIFWLIDLNRFYQGDVMIRSIDKMAEFTSKKFNVTRTDTSYLDSIFEDTELDHKIDLTCQLDHAILALQGQRLPIGEVFRKIQNQCPNAFDIAIGVPYNTLAEVQKHMNIKEEKQHG